MNLEVLKYQNLAKKKKRQEPVFTHKAETDRMVGGLGLHLPRATAALPEHGPHTPGNPPLTPPT